MESVSLYHICCVQIYAITSPQWFCFFFHNFILWVNLVDVTKRIADSSENMTRWKIKNKTITIKFDGVDDDQSNISQIEEIFGMNRMSNFLFTIIWGKETTLLQQKVDEIVKRYPEMPKMEKVKYLLWIEWLYLRKE